MTNPENMNEIIAIKERGDRRDSPQIPWPLVQPDPY